MNTRISLTIVLLLSLLCAVAQTPREKADIRHQRLSKVEYYHVGVGMETGINENYFVGPRLQFGIGSHRNLLNADAGFKYLFGNPVGSNSNERLMLQQLPVFAAVHLNACRWSTGCIYVGGEAAYHIPVAARHHLPASDVVEHDSRIGQGHATVRGAIGARIGHWDIGLHYDYDLAPAMDQKHVFETEGFDYDQLHDSLFERWRIGMSVSYLIYF